MTDIRDQRVLRIACELSLAKDSDVLTPSDVVSHVEGSGMSEKQVLDSIRILDEEGLLAGSGALGTYVSHFRISGRGFELFCRDQLEGYDSIVQAIASEILNNGQYNSLRIAETLRQPRILVNHVMSEFAAQGFCKKSSEIGTPFTTFHRGFGAHILPEKRNLAAKSLIPEYLTCNSFKPKDLAGFHP